MIENKSYKFKGSNSRLITADLSYKSYEEEVPICLFVHGFKGFKDWGCWPLAAEIFALKGIPFFKINLSHNGTTPESMMDFVDLEAFGNNNFKFELEDIKTSIDFIHTKAPKFDFDWNGKIFVVGHSRGGSIALLSAAIDERINKVASWAAPSDLERYIQLKDQEEWQNDGVHYVANSRTGQQMPMYYQFVESFEQHRGMLSMEDQLEDLTCPAFIAHGTNDQAVPLDDALAIYNMIGHSILVEIENADHTFNMKHPMTERKITKEFAEVVTETIEFLNL